MHDIAANQDCMSVVALESREISGGQMWGAHAAAARGPRGVAHCVAPGTGNLGVSPFARVPSHGCSGDAASCLNVSAMPPGTVMDQAIAGVSGSGLLSYPGEGLIRDGLSDLAGAIHNI